MQGLVSLTDRSWFDHLSSLAREHGGRLDEVNFWRPKSQQALKAIPTGAPFFLRLKSPVNKIAGFGFFAHWHLVPFLQAWELFDQKNGAPDLAAFRRQIQSLRGSDPLEPGQSPLGCVILRDVVFLDESEWLPWDETKEWSRNVVNDKKYDLTQPPGTELLALLQSRTVQPMDLADEFRIVERDGRTWREHVLPNREGQGTFRLRLLEAYESRCAVTAERVVPVLDASHIQPYFGVESNHVQNGLLLRSDLHRLYDRGYVSVTPDHTLIVSERIHDEWENGREYYEMQDRKIRVPDQPERRPSREALAWHKEYVFR